MSVTDIEKSLRNFRVDDIREKMLDLKASLHNEMAIPQRNLSDLRGFILHCTGDSDVVEKEDVWAIAKYDMSPGNHICASGLAIITYGYYVEYDSDGLKVWRCANDSDKTAHAGDVLYNKIKWNSLYIGIAVDYDGADDPLSDDKYDALTSLFALKCIQYGKDPMTSIEFHRNLLGSGWYYVMPHDQSKSVPIGTFGAIRVQRKVCPGMKIDLEDFRKKVSEKVNLLTDPFQVFMARKIVVPFLPMGTPCWTTEYRNIVKHYQAYRAIDPTGIIDDKTQLSLQKDLTDAGLEYSPF